MVNNQGRITDIFSALSDPTRRRILGRLSRDGEWPVSALAKPFRISPPAISRHLRVLERAQLIGRRREGRSQVIRARLDGLRPAQDWMTQCAASWDLSFDRLDILLKEEQGKRKHDEVRNRSSR